MSTARIVVLAGGMLAVSVLSAEATARFLPSSSFMEGTADNGGSQVDYAVYDLVDYGDDLQGYDWFDFSGVSLKRYVYAYQVFNTGTEEIWSFTVAGIGAGALAGIRQVGQLDDGSGGAVPDDWWLTPGFTESNWQFAAPRIDPDGHSSVLILTSNNAPTDGVFRVNEPGIPEPATVMLLGLGAVWVRCRRRR